MRGKYVLVGSACRVATVALGVAALASLSPAIEPGVALMGLEQCTAISAPDSATCQYDSTYAGQLGRSNAQTPTASAQSSLDEGAEAASDEQSSASAKTDQAQATSTSAAATHSHAAAQSQGQRALSSSAAADHSATDAGAFGTNAASGAAASDYSGALSRAIGPDSNAQAAAANHDLAFALAGPYSSANVGPGTARCSGLGAGVEFRTGSACLSPLATPTTSTPKPGHNWPADSKHGRKHSDTLTVDHHHSH